MIDFLAVVGFFAIILVIAWRLDERMNRNRPPYNIPE